MDRRLVEDDDRRGLGDRDREQDELPFAERQLADVATDEPAEPDPVDRGGDRGPIVGPEPAEPVLVGQPAERHDRLDGRGERQARRLRDHRDPAGDLVAVEVPEATAGDRDVAADRRQRPGHEAKQRGLARAIRPDDRDRFAGADREVDVVDDGSAAVRRRDAAELQRRRRREDRSRHSS